MHNWRRYISFLKVEKMTKNAVLNLALCFGAIWHHREKPQHRCTITVHPVYNCLKKILENLLPIGLLVRTNLFIPDYLYELSHLLSALRSDMLEIFFIEVHIYIHGPKLLWWNILQISQLSTRSRAHKLFRRFLDFSKFLTAISRKLWRHLAIKMRLCSAPERAIHSEKRL